MQTSLHRSIREQDGEREVHQELESRPWVLKELVEGSGSNLCFVVSHFELGNEAEIDFVVLHGFSGGWDIHLIELEPPSLPPFNKLGNYSPRLNHAAGQIRRWKVFQEHRDKRPYLTAQLERAAKQRDLLWQDQRDPLDSIGRLFSHPESILFFHYHIIIGQRSHLNSNHFNKKAAMKSTDGFELITYDRVIEVFERQLESAAFSEIYRDEQTHAGNQRSADA